MTVDGDDRLPELLAGNDVESFEEGKLFGRSLLRTLGSVPNEYLYFYYAAREITARLQGGPTRGEVLLGDQSEFYRAVAADPATAREKWEATKERREATYLAETRTAVAQRDEADLTGGGYQEVALDLITALTGGAPTELIVNAANGSAVPALPPSLVLEARCRVDTTGAMVLPMDAPDLHQLGLMSSVRAAELAVISAVTTGSRAEAVRAFAIHPLVGSWVIAEQLTDGLLTDHPGLRELLR